MNADHDLRGDDVSATRRISTLDLNLLVAFDELARTRNVTQAAERLGVTQSAMSHTLRRLRAALDDPLLVRAGASMVLTPRAEALVVPLRAALGQLEQALRVPEPFAPQTSRRQFHIAAPDLAEMLLLPPLLARLRAEAPHVGIAMRAVQGPRARAMLENAELDLLISARLLDSSLPPEEHPGLYRRSLLHDGWRCYARDDHPVLGSARRLTLRRFLDASHAMVSPGGAGEGIVDTLLARDGLQRHVALRVPYFFSAPVAVAGSDLLLTAPAALAHLLGHLPLRTFVPPISIPEHSVDMAWHTRLHADPGHTWLRGLLADVGAAVGGVRRGRGGRSG